ncbi:unnamed protein product [Prorocentrum cordatum]|uniref:Uncharacterized protein n=1 Tax=Prorocentrum cordatum TaxID=2364126 RepID=A0ABN9YDT4_9DINO|nr:unnamed protein product [Polarella glacialis]
MAPVTQPLLHAVAALGLLTAWAPLAHGIAFKSEASRKADRKITNAEGRAAALVARVAQYERAIEARANASKGPLLVPPDFSRTGRASLLGVDSSQGLAGGGEFQPSEEFQRAGQESGDAAVLPWGVGTPRGGDSWVEHQYSAMHMLDVPHWVEYSLEIHRGQHPDLLQRLAGRQLGFDTQGVLDMLSGHQIHAYNLPTFMEELGGRKTIDFWAVHNGHYEAEVLNETFFYSGKNIEFGVVLVRFDGRRSGRGYQWFAQHRSKDETEELIFEIMHNASFNYIGGLDAYWINYVEPRFHYNDHVWVNPAYFEKRGLPVPTWCKSAPPPALRYPRQGHLDVPGLDNLEKWTGSGGSPGPHVYGHATDKKADAIPFGYGTPGIPYGPSSRNPWGIDHQEYDNPAYMSLGGSNPTIPGPEGGGGTWDPRWNWDAGYTYEEETSKVIAYIAKAKEDAAATEPVAKAHRVAYNRLMSVEGR